MLKSEPDLSNIVIVVMGVGGGGNQDVIYFTDTDTDDGDIVGIISMIVHQIMTMDIR